MPSTQVGESEFSHMATGGRSSWEMLMGGFSVVTVSNKLHAAHWMTFVKLTGLVTWENLSKPHTITVVSFTKSFPKDPNIYGQEWRHS